MIVDLERGKSFAYDAASVPNPSRVFEGVVDEVTECGTGVMRVVPGEEIVPDSPADVAERAAGMRLALSQVLRAEVKVEAYTSDELQALLLVSALVQCPDLETVRTAEAMHSRLLTEQVCGVSVDDADNAAPMLIQLEPAASPHSMKSVKALRREMCQTTHTRNSAKARGDYADAAYAQEYLDCLIAELAQRQ